MIRRRYRVIERIVGAPHLFAIVSRHWTSWGALICADSEAYRAERDDLPLEYIVEEA